MVSVVKDRKIDTLNQKSINGIRPTGKRQLFFDGNYLYLSVSATGKKSFYFRGFRFNGQVVNEFSLGTYRVNDKDTSGDLTLAEAREKTREIIRTYRQGINYHQQQKELKAKAIFEQTNTLDDWFNRWIETKSDTAQSTQRDYRGRYAKWISPKIGRRSIVGLSEDDYEIEALYKHIQKQCSPEMAKRCDIILSGVFRLAKKKKIIRANPSDFARDEIKKTQQANFPAITSPDEMGKLLLDIDNVKGIVSTKYAFKLIPYLMLRPDNLVNLKWSDVDFQQQIIFIDAERMKTDVEHCIPYPKQVTEILNELKDITGHGEYLLPNRQGKGHMHRDVLSKALRNMGYQGKHTPHGFRSSASTWLYDNHYYSYAIEKQLAHTEGSKVVKAYSRDYTLRYLDDRRKLLQDYANYLDVLRQNADKTILNNT